ncbi:S49 family peptidase [Acidiphilium acidophilum]|uniref:S49 family peptidase n=1 Tax=Acidiphilium acidophilum TaxID=76588 RepID=UPI002E8E7946|nr:S49 family peptidase [Acidiphilium acidophilum]
MNETPPNRSVASRIGSFLWGIVKFIVFGLGIILLLLLIGSYAAFRHLQTQQHKPLPGKFALELNLTQPVPDTPVPPPWLRFGGAARPTLLQTIQAIDRAGHDDHVTGIDIELGSACCSLTTAEELHNAIARYRAETGKPVIARAMSLDGAAGLGAYIVATAASRIELSAAGDFGVTGLALLTPFGAGTLDKLGIAAQFEHIGKYKTYPQMFTRSQPSKANLHMLNSMVGSLYKSALAPIAARLHETPDQIKALIDQAPFSAEQAKQDHLIDAVLPVDFRIDHFKGNTAGVTRFDQDAPKAAADATRIALIIAHGDIEAPSASGNADSIDPRHLADELSDAIDDAKVKAIVLRLDTPGGTVTGSALIGAEVARAAAVHKPLIVSMGALDASGGYWVSSHGAVLVADPATITGSIGVLGGKLSFGGLLDKIGLTVTGASRGANALFDSPVNKWTPAQLANLQTSLNLDYQQFIDWVAAGRHMTPAQVDAIGQGREWTGTQAKQRGLVDQLGGYHTAFEAVRAALKLPVHAPLDITDGNARPGLHALLREALQKASPLGMADLPPQLQALMAAAHLHRLSMLPVEIH